MRFLIVAIVGIMLSAPLWAEGKYSIKKMTPQVQQALNQRRERFDSLRSFKSSQAIGENNRGYVTAFSDGKAASIAEAENADREVIYSTIAQQNGLSDNMPAIERVFAQVQRDKAQAGDKIQSEDGAWSVK